MTRLSDRPGWAFALLTGNPPSGVASGYVWFDVLALALAPRMLSLRARLAPARA